MITYARETFDQAIEDVKPWLKQHWGEMAQRQDDIPLDPDFTMYKHIFDSGMMCIYTARDDGRLIGYCIMYVTPRHLHYKHRWAKDDTIWIEPKHRNIGVATGLFDFFEGDLAATGPIVIQIETRYGHPELEMLLTSRGYGPTGKIMGKRIA